MDEAGCRLPAVRPGDLQNKGTAYSVGSDAVLRAGRLFAPSAEQFEKLLVCHWLILTAPVDRETGEHCTALH